MNGERSGCPFQGPSSLGWNPAIYLSDCGFITTGRKSALHHPYR
jgi:hypothetical protein